MFKCIMCIRSVERFHFAWLKLSLSWVAAFSSPFLLAPGSYHSSLCFCEFKYFRYPMFVESRQYLFFCSWLLLYLTQCPQESCFSLEQDFLLLLWLDIILFYVYTKLYHSPIDGCLNYFYLLAIVNNDVVNINVQITSSRFLFQLFWIYTQMWDCWIIC